MEGDVSKGQADAAADKNFYPRPPCGGRRVSQPNQLRAYVISIHALRVEGDRHPRGLLFRRSGISIHALRVEGDLNHTSYACVTFISIHALRVEGDPIYLTNKLTKLQISIHALRVEGDRVRR